MATQPVWGQTTYYVASNGSDANNGKSATSPFQNLAKINSLPLQAGDVVLFRRGDTFRGTLQLTESGSASSPIVIDAYGSGNKPILSGAIPITNWTSIGTNIWQASCPTCGDQVTGLYRDNTSLPLGRYPNLDATNKGYLTVQSHVGKTQLTSQQALSTNWTGGEAVFRPVQWILNRSKITGRSGNTLTLDGSGNYDIANNWGYFIQNHPATLDQNGEWYYNPTNKTIQLYNSQANPNSQQIAATAFAQAVNLASVSFVTIRNIQISQSLNTGLLATNSSNLVITNNDITQSGEDGILIQGSGQQILVEGNRIEEVNNNGVNIADYQNVTFRGNTVRSIGLLPGRGKSGDGNYVGFQSKSTANTLIENNVLDNIGYNALNFSTNTTIQRNQISNFCLIKSDGSGLYIWNGNQQALTNIRLLSNIVFNGIGAPEGSPSGTPTAANGIYLDDCTTNIEVRDNTVYNCKGAGIYLHGSSTITITGNTVYNNSETQLSIKSANSCQPRTNVIQNNIFVSRSTDQYTAKYESSQNDLASYGQFDNNVYARPFDDNLKIFAVYNNTTGASLSLAQWQSKYGKDPNSANSPVTYTSGNPDDYIKLFANPTANASQVTLDGTYRDARNVVYTGQVTVPAFSSVLLLKDITPPVTLRTPENPANTVAGLDYKYYENSWSSLPDFTALTPVKSGTTTTVSLSVRSRDSSYGLRFTGYISVPTDGVYTFYTNSDDGSKLLIGTTEVVNNDGGHSEQERSGTIGLKAGVHAITVVYFQSTGNQVLSVSYSGPSINKQVIPDASFRRIATVAPPDQPSSVRAYSMAKDAQKTSQITTRVELRNEGNTTITRQDLSVRYWFTSDNGQLAKVYVDYAAIGSSNVQAKVVQISSVTGADSYVELKLLGTTTLAPAASLGAIDFRLVRSDYGLFDQSNDYSYVGNFGNVLLNPRVCVYLKGVLVYGTPPTGASGRLAATEESPAELQVRVLGNPVVGSSAQIEISGVSGQRVEVGVVDSQGRRWHQQTIPQASLIDQLSVPLSNSRGLLLLQVSSEGQSQTIKMIKPE
ncbi:right-handed parallel beta-helix repeat-containing protein [Spirosoma arboris]|uniref:right-handed parallel beta-helix repeat-containing protein n=1 Tax=Spirosoma arboris TaxID=2682092 RepID=UPI001D0F66EC|nr:right-handed parallel beta-helix repeat-containing protein [Spirosoma arboris]